MTQPPKSRRKYGTFIPEPQAFIVVVLKNGLRKRGRRRLRRNGLWERDAGTQGSNGNRRRSGEELDREEAQWKTRTGPPGRQLYRDHGS